MGAFLSGCFGFIAIVFALAFFIQYPPIFWGVVAVFVTVIFLGFREGLRQKREREAGGRGPGFLKAVPDDDEEGDIRHHYDYSGTPRSIDDPNTIQNQSMGVDDDEDEER